MPPTMRPTSSVVASFVAVLCLATSAQAERADRTRPMVIDSDGKQAATVDLNRKLSVLSGNVVITQGSLQVKADKVEIREEAPGRYQATARGAEGRPATFRQKRDRLDEYVEADAERIEYDGNAERVRFVGNAHLRILRSGTVGDEASAATIVYDQRGDTLTFEGGGPTNAGGTPGRARLVFVPREAPASAPAAGGAQ
jgi:lipopolysaccharide export system protein LptA